MLFCFVCLILMRTKEGWVIEMGMTQYHIYSFVPFTLCRPAYECIQQVPSAKTSSHANIHHNRHSHHYSPSTTHQDNNHYHHPTPRPASSSGDGVGGGGDGGGGGGGGEGQRDRSGASSRHGRTSDEERHYRRQSSRMRNYMNRSTLHRVIDLPEGYGMEICCKLQRH